LLRGPWVPLQNPLCKLTTALGASSPKSGRIIRIDPVQALASLERDRARRWRSLFVWSFRFRSGLSPLRRPQTQRADASRGAPSGLLHCTCMLGAVGGLRDFTWHEHCADLKPDRRRTEIREPRLVAPSTLARCRLGCRKGAAPSVAFNACPLSPRLQERSCALRPLIRFICSLPSIFSFASPPASRRRRSLSVAVWTARSFQLPGIPAGRARVPAGNCARGRGMLPGRRKNFTPKF
jgi:hypothetical protein